MNLSNTSVLVVIPTLNEAKHIETVLAELSEGLQKNFPVKFVVCDGGSTDGTTDKVARVAAKDPRFILLHNAKVLQSAAVNHAVRVHGAGFDVLIRCDAHASYPQGFIINLVRTLAETGADSVVVPMDSTGDACMSRAVAWVSDSRVGSGGSAHRGGAKSGYVDHGHHAAFLMKTFIRVGGYDESFSHNEDAEFDCRQRALGAKVFLDSSIRIGYMPRDSFRGLWRQYRFYGRGRARTVRKHPGSLRARQFAVPANLLLVAGGLLALPVTPWIAMWSAFYLLVLCGASVSTTLTKKSQCGLLVGPAAFVMHTAWALGFLGGLIFSAEDRWSVDDTVPLSLGRNDETSYVA